MSSLQCFQSLFMLLPRLLLLLLLLLMLGYTTPEEICYIIFVRSLLVFVSGSAFSAQVNLDRVLIDSPS